MAFADVRFSVVALAGALLLQPAEPSRAEGSQKEQVATSCADCPSYSGAFSIRNDTGVLIHYQYRWVDKHPWKRMDLPTGRIETHRYPLGEDPATKVPTPFVRFDDLADGHRTTFREYRMGFHAVGYAGYGPKVDTTEPKRYHFQYFGDGRHLDLKAD